MYEKCRPLMPGITLLLPSAILPCNGGMMAPPNIIIIKNADPWLVYFPKPVMDSAKMDGHIIEQHKPPLMKEKVAKRPVVNKPVSIKAIPNKPNTASVRVGCCLPIKKATTKMATLTA